MTDLFDTPEQMPDELKAIFDDFDEDMVENEPYALCSKLLREVNAIGYTFSFGLDGQPYNLRKL
jgi:hypothetical protein